MNDTMSDETKALVTAWIEKCKASDDDLVSNYISIRDRLVADGVAYKSTVRVLDIVAHPSNRGGIMLNHHDAHEVLSRVFKGGVSVDELRGATAFELFPMMSDQRAYQLQRNRDIIERSGGMLAPLSGSERIATVGCSHFSSALKAALAGCITEVDALKPSGSNKLSPEHLCTKPGFKELLNDGIEFLIYPWSVEMTWPELPNIAQRALNAGGQNANRQSECEVLLSIVHAADQQLKRGEAICWRSCASIACASNPPCAEYKDKLCTLAQKYAGGTAAPFSTAPRGR